MHLDFGYTAGGRRRTTDAGVRCHAIRLDGVALCGFTSPVHGFECLAEREDVTCRRCKAALAKIAP